MELFDFWLIYLFNFVCSCSMSMSVCLSVCMYVCIQVCVPMCAHVEAILRGHRMSCLYHLELDWQSTNPSDPPVTLSPTVPWLQGHVRLFIWLLEIQTGFLTLGQQVLLPANPSPQPLLWFCHFVHNSSVIVIVTGSMDILLFSVYLTVFQSLPFVSLLFFYMVLSFSICSSLFLLILFNLFPFPLSSVIFVFNQSWWARSGLLLGFLPSCVLHF